MKNKVHIEDHHAVCAPVSGNDSRIYTEYDADDLNLVKKAQAGDESAFNELIEEKQKLIQKLILEFAYSPVSNEELLAIGNRTLQKSIRIFDVRRGTRFSSFAYWGIKQAFQRATDTARSVSQASSSQANSILGDALGDALDDALKNGRYQESAEKIEPSSIQPRLHDQAVHSTDTPSFSLADETPKVAHTRPVGFNFWDQEYSVRSWTDFVIEIARLVRNDKHGDLLDDVSPSAIEFTSRLCIGPSSAGMIVPKKIDDTLWIETNFNAKQLVDFAKWLTWWCNVEQSKVIVRYQKKNVESVEQSIEKTREERKVSGITHKPVSVVALSPDESAEIKSLSNYKHISFNDIHLVSLDYTTPVMLEYEETDISVRNWREVLTAFAEFLASRPEFLKKLMNGAVEPSYRLLSVRAEELRRPYQIKENLYIETNLSSSYCLKSAADLGRVVGLNYRQTPCTVYYSAKGENVQRVGRCSSFSDEAFPMLRKEFISECSVILEDGFLRGLRKDSIIDKNKFCRKYEELTGEPPQEKDLEHLWEACASCGVVVDDKVFPLNEHAVTLVKSVMGEILGSGNQQGYYSVIFEEHQQDFNDSGIGSAEVLAGIMRKVYPEYEYCEQFFRVNRSVSAEDEILRVLTEHDSLSLEELQGFLRGMPLDRLSQACRSTVKIVKDGDKYYLLDKLKFDELEVERAISKIQDSIQKHEYALLREMNLEVSESLNAGISLAALQRGAYQKYLAESYDINRGIISDKGASLSVGKVLAAFCKSQVDFTLTEIENMAKELNGYSSNQGLAVAKNEAIQVDEEHFIQPSMLDFDIEGIDNALEQLVTDRILPLQQVSSFMSFPAVSGYVWTWQMLASYCRLVSRHFHFMEATTSNACTGLIIQSTISYDNYYQAVAALAIRNKVPQNLDAIGDYALEMGLLARKRPSALTSILTEMKKQSGDS